MGGGISVIIGVLFVAKGNYKLGKFIIGFGADFELFGLIFLLIKFLLAGTLI
ncbi:MAG: hypothetical protein ACFFAN_15370 [Promethearchaeota archaeon]